MAGYSGHSKSNNAIDAERQGLMTASAAAKALKVSAAAVKDVLTPSEWHHTSKCFNKTSYYDIERHLAVLAGEFDVRLDEVADEDYDAAAEMIDMRKFTRGWTGESACPACGKRFATAIIKRSLCLCGTPLEEVYKSLKTAKQVDNCIVEWLEWPFAPGRGGRYANRRPKECRAENCAVEVKGQTATIIFADGGKMTKRLSTAGFSFSPAGREEVAC